MIPPETIEQIAAANDIVDVIGSYFPLKRAGSEFKALCPFHQEKSPSFSVSPQRQLFYCFGCGAGGSVFDFVARYENIDFPTAATRLAERAGIRIVEQERSPDDAREFNLRKRLLDLHQQAAEWFHKLLMKAPAAESARAYLNKRGLTSEVSKRWKIGYAPAKWDALIRWAQGQDFKTDEIVQSGLVSLRDAEDPQSDFYDRFRDRVMFPICNDLGEVIAFSGRLLAPDVKAVKYVNSPETPLFKKGDILFGLHKSKRAIIDEKRAIVLEGQIDLITAFEAGVRNVVASQGTAFTEKQARTLKRYAEEVVLCFDADQAGRKAAERSLPALLGLSLGIRVIELPPGEDPDSLIRGQGAAAFISRVEAARDYFDYRIEAAAASPDFASPQRKTEFARSMAASARLIGDKLLREAVAAKVATRLGMVLPNFWKLLSDSGSRSDKAPAPESKPGFLNPTAIKAPINGLTLVALADPEIRRWISAQPWSLRLLDMEGAGLLVKILDSDISLSEPASLSTFATTLDESARELFGSLLREPLPEDRLAAARDYWNAIEKRDLLHRRDLLLARMRDPNLSQGEITEIQKQVLDVQKLLTDISRPLSPPGLE
jgi:DNA primase